MDQMRGEISMGHLFSYVVANVSVFGGSIGKGKSYMAISFFRIFSFFLIKGCL